METRLGQSWVGSPGRKVRGPGSIKGRSNGCGTGCRVGFVFTKLLRNSETEALFPENSCFSSPRSSGGWGHLCTSTLPALLLLSKAACSLCWSFGHTPREPTTGLKPRPGCQQDVSLPVPASSGPSLPKEGLPQGPWGPGRSPPGTKGRVEGSGGAQSRQPTEEAAWARRCHVTRSPDALI